MQSTSPIITEKQIRNYLGKLSKLSQVLIVLNFKALISEMIIINLPFIYRCHALKHYSDNIKREYATLIMTLHAIDIC